MRRDSSFQRRAGGCGGPLARCCAAALGSLLLLGAGSAGHPVRDAELDAVLAVLASGSGSDAAGGEAAYASCAVCHLANGAGRADGTFPQLAGQHAEVIAKQLVDIRSGRRENPIMQPYAKRLRGPQEIAELARYVSALPVPGDPGVGPGDDLARGEASYQRDCARCHGARGEGDGARFVPRLAGQHYLYLLRQIRDIGSGRRHNAHPEMVALVARAPDAELRALVDYASRLRPAAPATPPGGDAAAKEPSP